MKKFLLSALRALCVIIVTSLIGMGAMLPFYDATDFTAQNPLQLFLGILILAGIPLFLFWTIFGLYTNRFPRFKYLIYPGYAALFTMIILIPLILIIIKNATGFYMPPKEYMKLAAGFAVLAFFYGTVTGLLVYGWERLSAYIKTQKSKS